MKFELLKNLVLEVAEDGDVRLNGQSKWNRLAELQIPGFNQNDHHGPKHTGTQPGSLLRYKSHKLEPGKLEITQEWQGLEVTSHMQLFDGISVVRSWTVARNNSVESWPIEYISSFALTGLCGGGQAGRGHIPHNTWFGGCQWESLHPCRIRLRPRSRGFFHEADKSFLHGQLALQRILAYGRL